MQRIAGPPGWDCATARAWGIDPGDLELPALWGAAGQGGQHPGFRPRGVPACPARSNARRCPARHDGLLAASVKMPWTRSSGAMRWRSAATALYPRTAASRALRPSSGWALRGTPCRDRSPSAVGSQWHTSGSTSADEGCTIIAASTPSSAPASIMAILPPLPLLGGRAEDHQVAVEFVDHRCCGQRRHPGRRRRRCCGRRRDRYRAGRRGSDITATARLAGVA